MIGQTLGGYRIVDSVGSGGMADVYKAYDAGTDRYVAIKILPRYHAKDPTFRKRFEREAKAIARLEHPHILPVHGYGEEDDIAFMVMRYVEGGTLTDAIKETGQFDLRYASMVLTQIASALDYAHKRGILHRDIKPSNVLIDEDGNTYLGDFGIAKMVEGSTMDLTGSGVIGTPFYMSPEQCRGEKTLSPKTDQYSLGIIVFELVTGSIPFNAETPMAVILKHLNAPLPMPTDLRPDLPVQIENVILKALSKDADKRFDSCSEFARAFASAIDYYSETEKFAVPRAADEEAVPLTLPEPWQEQTAGAGIPASASEETVPAGQRQQAQQPPAARKPGRPWWHWAMGGVVALALIAAGIVLALTLPGNDADDGTAADQPDNTDVLDNATGSTGTSDTMGLVETGNTGQPTTAVSVSRDGQYVAMITDKLTNYRADSMGTVWESDPGRQLTNLAFSPDGTLLVTGMEDGGVVFWDAVRGGLIMQVPGGSAHEQWVTRVAFSPTGRYVATVSDDATCIIWNVTTKTIYRRFTNNTLQGRLGLIHVGFSPDERFVAAADGAGGITIWDIEADSYLTDLDAFEHAASALDWSPDGRQIAAGSTYGDLAVWDVQQKAALFSVSIHYRDENGNAGPVDGEAAILDLAWSGDGSMIAVGAVNGKASVWDAVSGQEMQDFPVAGDVSFVAWLDDSQALVAGDSSGYYYRWEVGGDGTAGNEGDPPPAEQEPGGTVAGYPPAPAGTRIAVGCEALGMGQGLCTADSDGGGISVLVEGVYWISMPSWSPDGTQLIFDGTTDAAQPPDLYIINADGTGLEKVFDDGDNVLPAWSPDGQSTAFVWNGGIFLFDPAGKVVVDNVPFDEGGSQGTPLAVQWSPDGQMLVISVWDDGETKQRRVYGYDVASGESTVLQTDSGYFGDDRHDHLVAFSPEGTHIALIDIHQQVWLVSIDNPDDRVALDGFPIEWTAMVYPQWPAN